MNGIQDIKEYKTCLPTQTLLPTLLTPEYHQTHNSTNTLYARAL